MDTLKQLQQLVTLRVRSMSPIARWSAGALLVLMAVSLPHLVGRSTPTPDTYLLNDESLTPGQLPAMEAAFAKAGLTDYAIEGRRVKVPGHQRSRYMAALADADVLPTNFGDILDVAIRDVSPFAGREQKAEGIKNARQRELAQIIAAMRGIDKAMVMYDVAEPGGLGRNKILTASVSVKPSGQQTLTLSQVRTVRNLVASAIAGLEPAHVSVTDLNSGRNFSANSQQDSELVADMIAERKSAYELQCAQRIKDALSWVPGIEVHVEARLRPAERSTALRTDAVLPQALSVLLSVPRGYLDTVWRQTHRGPAHANVPPTAHEIDRFKTELATDLRAHVAGLLPELRNVPDARLDVQLTVLDKPTRPGPGTRMTKTTPAASGVSAALQVLGLSVLAVVGLLTLKWMNRPAGQAAYDELETPSEPQEDAPAAPAVGTSMAKAVAAHDVPPPDTHLLPATSSASVPSPQLSPRNRINSRRLVPQQNVTGIELNDLTYSRLTSVSASDRAGAVADVQASGQTFEFLKNASPEVLADFLANENPQLAAVVFSHLESQRAAQVLDLLPAELQVDVVRRLSNLDEMSDEVLQDIENGLELSLTTQIKRTERRNAGIAAVNKILDTLRGPTRQRLLNRLYPGNAGSVRDRQARDAARRQVPVDTAPPPDRTAAAEPSVTFEDVLRLDDNTLCQVLAAADPQVAILALASGTSETVDRLLNKMKPRDANRLRHALGTLGPTSLQDIESSKQALIQVASKLQAKGRIRMEDASAAPIPA